MKVGESERVQETYDLTSLCRTFFSIVRDWSLN